MEKEEKQTTEQVQKAYIYLVKTPQSNDITVCAGNLVFYPGTYVVAPTRYGLDMGIVIGNASNLDKTGYCQGCSEVRGACHFAHTDNPDDNLAAMGELPKFEFVSYKGKPVFEEDSPEETGLWDSRFIKPEMVEVDGDVSWITRKATEEDIEKYRKNIEEEKKAIEICREKIANHKLEMKLVSAHFLLCEPKALFFFTAEDRVDFRELVKDLVSVFKMRIELRQIGVRDESRVLGGLAACGRDFCCHCVSDKLDPVTIKMAKEQNLSLNSMKISGPCGRLLCCLSYEYDFYCEEKMAYPQEGIKIKLGDELFKVQEVNILSKKLTVTGPEGGEVVIPREKLFWSDKNDRWEVDREFQQEFLGN